MGLSFLSSNTTDSNSNTTNNSNSNSNRSDDKNNINNNNNDNNKRRRRKKKTKKVLLLLFQGLRSKQSLGGTSTRMSTSRDRDSTDNSNSHSNTSSIAAINGITKTTTTAAATATAVATAATTTTTTNSWNNLSTRAVVDPIEAQNQFQRQSQRQQPQPQPQPQPRLLPRQVIKRDHPNPCLVNRTPPTATVNKSENRNMNTLNNASNNASNTFTSKRIKGISTSLQNLLSFETRKSRKISCPPPPPPPPPSSLPPSNINNNNHYNNNNNNTDYKNKISNRNNENDGRYDDTDENDYNGDQYQNQYQCQYDDHDHDASMSLDTRKSTPRAKGRTDSNLGGKSSYCSQTQTRTRTSRARAQAQAQARIHKRSTNNNTQLLRCNTEKVVNTGQRRQRQRQRQRQHLNSNSNPNPSSSSSSNSNRIDTERNMNILTKKYALSSSVDFLSLVLPFDSDVHMNTTSTSSHTYTNSSANRNRGGGMGSGGGGGGEYFTFVEAQSPSSVMSIPESDATTATSTTVTGVTGGTGGTGATGATSMDLMSIMSGQTTLAKDRVLETIACSESIRSYFDHLKIHNDARFQLDASSPISVKNLNLVKQQQPQQQQQQREKEKEELALPPSRSTPITPPPPPPPQRHEPINVDFVLESNECEIAQFAESYIQSKRFVEAIDIYLTVLDHYQKQFGPQYPIVIVTLHNLGVVHVLQGNFKKAFYYCREALKRRKKTLGSTHLEVAKSLCELGIIYYAMEDFNRGLEALREALHIACGAGGTGENNPNFFVAKILNNIGILHYSMGKLIASIATFEESLDIQRSIMGSIAGDEAGHMLLNMSVTLINAGMVSAKHNQLEVASSLVEEGLIVQQSVLPDNHRAVKSTLKLLSSLLHQDGNSEPLPSIEELEIKLPRQLSLGSQRRMNEAMSRCVDMISLGSVRNEMNSHQRVSNSMQYKYLAQLIISEGHSKRHCSWVDVGEHVSSEKAFNLSTICEQASRHLKQNETAKATELFHRIRRSRSNKCGDVDLIVASIHHILGLIYLHTQNYQSARVELQEATKIRSRRLDPDHSDVLASQTKRAITMIALQDFDKALSTLQRLLTHLRKRFGYNHYSIAITLNCIGICHYEFGGTLTALKSFEESVEILQGSTLESKSDDDKKFLSILLSRALSNLSFIQFKRKEYAEAIVALEETLKVQRIAFGKHHAYVKSTIESLAFIMAVANCLDNKDKLNQVTKMYCEMLRQ